MHRTSRLLHPPHEDLLADALLGPDHPLVRVLQRRKLVLDWSLVVAAVLSASVVAFADGVSAALAVVLATAIVESVLVCDAAMLSCSKRDRVLDLIVQGRGDLPLTAIACARRRLLDREHQQHLAGWLDGIETKPSIPCGLDDVPARSSVSVSSSRWPPNWPPSPRNCAAKTPGCAASQPPSAYSSTGPRRSTGTTRTASARNCTASATSSPAEPPSGSYADHLEPCSCMASSG